MLTNYFKSAVRHLRKQKSFSLINIVGLALGIACCILIMLFVRSEFSYDTFHAHSDRLYRAYVDEQYEGQRFFNTVTPIPLGPRLKADFPEVEQTVRLYAAPDVVRRGDRQFTEGIHLVDSTFFEVFDFTLLSGDPSNVLDKPGSIVVTEEMAAKYFPDARPLGKTIEARVGGREKVFTVTGIAEDPPENSSIQFDLLVPWSENGFRAASKEAWHQVYPQTFVLLQPGVEAAQFSDRLPSLVDRVIEEDYRSGYALGLQPVTDLHMNTLLPADVAAASDPAYSYILSAMALFILIIACINFIMLALGRSAERAREVGVRKSVGAHRRQLAAQFWGESLILVTAALGVGLVLAQIFLPVFNELAGRSLALDMSPAFLGFIAALLLVVGLAVGYYPAMVLSDFAPARVLKGRVNVGQDKGLLGRGLVIVQFGLAIFLIASTLVMDRQLDLLQTKNLGFDTEQVVTIPTTGDFAEGFRTYERLRATLKGQPGIEHVTASAFSFGGPGWVTIGYDAEDGQYREFKANFAGYDFLKTFGIELTAGRAFSRQIASDTSRGILVNETLVEELGWENPLGKRLPGPFPEHEIIGVVADFNFASLRTDVEPLVIAANFDLVLRGAANVFFPGSPTPKISVRISGDTVADAMQQIEQAWTAVAPAQPFTFTFLDEAVDSQYRQEDRLGQIVTVASVLAILIACLGLFGLVTLMVSRRTKEIGVRKVLGASVPSIVALLSSDFLKLVAIAAMLAIPVAYITMRTWLTDFAYRIDLGPGIFLLAGVLAVVIALATISYQSIRAATTDPVKVLRTE